MKKMNLSNCIEANSENMGFVEFVGESKFKKNLNMKYFVTSSVVYFDFNPFAPGKLV